MTATTLTGEQVCDRVNTTVGSRQVHFKLLVVGRGPRGCFGQMSLPLFSRAALFQLSKPTQPAFHFLCSGEENKVANYLLQTPPPTSDLFDYRMVVGFHFSHNYTFKTLQLSPSTLELQYVAVFSQKDSLKVLSVASLSSFLLG